MFASFGAIGTLAVLDVNGDGVADVVGASGATGLTAYTVVPGGLSLVPLAGVSLPAWAPVVGDFDQDGDRDLIVSTAQGHRVLLSAAQGLAEIPGYLATHAMWSRMFAGDLEGDGDADLIGCDATALAIVRNAGDGRLTWDASMPCTGPCPVCPSNVVIHPFDADQDGDLDVYVCNGTVGAAMPLGDRLVRNNGTSFSATITFASSTTLVGAIDSGDIDGDGDNDLVISRFPFGYFYFVPVQVFFNQGNGVFGPILNVPTASWSMDVKLVDVDADGDLDLVEANYLPSTSATSALLLNNGSGSFSPAPAFPGLPAQFVSAGDLDGDGDTDLLLDNHVYVNAGNGTFSLGATLAFPPNFYRTSLLDADSDGDLDVIEGGRLYVNLGNGTFNPPIVIAPQGNWSAVADFDRDGDADFVTPNPYLELFTGLSRQLVRGDPARPGRLASLELYAPSLGSWQIYASMAPGMLSLPPFGTVWIDPVSAQLMAVGSFDAAGRATASAVVPSSPSVIGATFYLQAVVQGLPAAKLTNREIMTVTVFLTSLHREHEVELRSGPQQRHRDLVPALRGPREVRHELALRRAVGPALNGDETSPSRKPAFFAAACSPDPPTCFTRSAITGGDRPSFARSGSATRPPVVIRRKSQEDARQERSPFRRHPAGSVIVSFTGAPPRTTPASRLPESAAPCSTHWTSAIESIGWPARDL